jgi:ABC-type sulfate transport system permease component
MTSASSNTGWAIGYTLGIIVVLAVVALVVPILVLAHKIGKQAPQIDAELRKAVDNTAPLAALSTTIVYATTIIAGLNRGRTRLGG